MKKIIEMVILILLSSTACVNAQSYLCDADEASTGFVREGTWNRVEDAGYGGSYYRGEKGSSAEWIFSSLPGGKYVASVTWIPCPEAASNAVYRLTGGPVLGRFDQRDEGAFAFDLEVNKTDHRFARLSTFNGYVPFEVEEGGTVSISLTSEGEGVLIADAIRLEKVAPDVEKIFVIDNGDSGPGFSVNDASHWMSWSGDAGDHGFDFMYNPHTYPNSEATFHFTGLDRGTYRLAGTWVPAPGRDKSVRYSVRGFGERAVDQTRSPNADLFEEVVWKNIFYDLPIEDGTLTVTLKSEGAYLIADAVRLEKVSVSRREDFCLIDDFEDYEEGEELSLGGRWISHPFYYDNGNRYPDGRVVTTNGVKAARIVGYPNSGYALQLGGDRILSDETATLFFRLCCLDRDGGISLFLTDGSPHVEWKDRTSNTWWNFYRAGIYLMPNALRPSVGAQSVFKDYPVSVWLNCWVVVNNSEGFFDFYMTGGRDTAVNPEKHIASFKNIPFDNKTVSIEDYEALMVSNLSELKRNTGVMIDDLYISRGERLTLPSAVANPATLLLLE